MIYHNAGSTAPDHGSPASRMALIVAASPVSRIVIARTIERIYLRSHAVEPSEALDALQRRKPVLVIIDRTHDDAPIKPLLSELVQRRHNSDRKIPRVILVAESAQRRPLSDESAIDAVVSKPITPEALQPVVERLMLECGA